MWLLLSSLALFVLWPVATPCDASAKLRSNANVCYLKMKEPRRSLIANRHCNMAFFLPILRLANIVRRHAGHFCLAGYAAANTVIRMQKKSWCRPLLSCHPCQMPMLQHCSRIITYPPIIAFVKAICSKNLTRRLCRVARLAPRSCIRLRSSTYSARELSAFTNCPIS